MNATQILQYINQAAVMLNVAFGAVVGAAPADHPLPWWVVATVAALNAVVHSLPAPSGSALPPQVTKASALFLAAMIGLSTMTACGSTAQTVTDSCLTADRMLKAAISLDAQGKLTATQVNAVSVSGATINGFCSQSAPPTDAQAALAGINGAITSLATIPGVQ